MLAEETNLWIDLIKLMSNLAIYLILLLAKFWTFFYLFNINSEVYVNFTKNTEMNK